MSELRVQALRRAIATSLFVPLAAGALFAAQQTGVQLLEPVWIGFALLAASAIPTTVQLVTAATGHHWMQLERNWVGLAKWQRVVSSAVALVCGLTTGAALVLVLLSLFEMDAKATEGVPPAGIHAE